MLIAFPFCSAGIYAVIIATATAASIAPPTAWKIRDATSDGNPKTTNSGRNRRRNDRA